MNKPFCCVLGAYSKVCFCDKRLGKHSNNLNIPSVIFIFCYKPFIKTILTFLFIIVTFLICMYIFA